jgi:hypothetical protein
MTQSIDDIPIDRARSDSAMISAIAVSRKAMNGNNGNLFFKRKGWLSWTPLKFRQSALAVTTVLAGWPSFGRAVADVRLRTAGHRIGERRSRRRQRRRAYIQHHARRPHICNGPGGVRFNLAMRSALKRVRPVAAACRKARSHEGSVRSSATDGDRSTLAGRANYSLQGRGGAFCSLRAIAERRRASSSCSKLRVLASRRPTPLMPLSIR